MLPRYRDRADSRTTVWETAADRNQLSEDEFPESDPMVITDLMPKMHGAKSSVVAHVKELRVPSPLPPSEVAMKVAAQMKAEEGEPETHRAPSNPPPALRSDSEVDFDAFNPDDSDLVPVVHHQSVRLYPASFPETRRAPTYDDVRPFNHFDDRIDDAMEPMRRSYTPHPAQPGMSAYALVSESLMPQVIGLEIVTTPPPAPTSWRHRFAMAAIWAVVISTGGGAIGYSRGDFTKQDVLYSAACAQSAVAEIAHVSQPRVDHPRRHTRTWK